MKKQIRIVFPNLKHEGELIVDLADPTDDSPVDLLFGVTEYGHVVIAYNKERTFPRISEDSTIDPKNYFVEETEVFEGVPGVQFLASDRTVGLVLGPTNVAPYFAVAEMIAQQKNALVLLRRSTMNTPGCLVTGDC